jgi:PIN domain nuclease of toxin-antitoxin system
MRHDGAPLLLDTHVWVWMTLGDARLKGAPCVSTIESAVVASNAFLSPISVWEVALLEQKGRLRLPVGCMQWVRTALDESGFRVAPFTPEIAVDSVRLPGELHGDPADRILIATARAMGATLVTHDRQILRYGARNLVRTLAV